MSCASATFCAANEQWYSRLAEGDRLEVYRDHTWTAEPMVLPKSYTGGAAIDDLSCPRANNCVAVGNANKGTFVMTLAGPRWTSLALQAPFKKGQLGLSAISCVAVGSCTAAGVATAPGKGEANVTETLAGGAWRVRQISPFSKSTESLPGSISCAAVDRCAMSVLSISFVLSGGGISFGEQSTLEALTGATWSKVGYSLPPDNVQTALEGVSCADASSCVAVGASATANGDSLPFVASG